MQVQIIFYVDLVVNGIALKDIGTAVIREISVKSHAFFLFSWKTIFFLAGIVFYPLRRIANDLHPLGSDISCLKILGAWIGCMACYGYTCETTGGNSFFLFLILPQAQSCLQ